MSTARLYCPHLRNGTNDLSGDEAHHAVHALRVDRNDVVVLFDGRGNEAVARVLRATRRALSVDVQKIAYFEFDTSTHMTLAVSMPKNHRQGYLIEKCTELGVAAIWPIRTERTVARTSQAAVTKLQRRAIEAAKQSGRRWLPEVRALQPFDQVLAQCPKFDRGSIAHCDDQSMRGPQWAATVQPGDRTIVLVGPEGGWAPDELEAARAAGLTPVRLVPTTLRTETAAVAIAAILNTMVAG